MHAWKIRFLTPLLLTLCALVATPGFATSLGGKGVSSKATVCAVSAKFTGTKFYHGKLLWTFDRTGTAEPINCESIARTFEVLIPSGSFSAISNSNVYPISITEPKPGTEIDLRLESVKFKTGDTHWLIADGVEAYRIKH